MIAGYLFTNVLIMPTKGGKVSKNGKDHKQKKKTGKKETIGEMINPFSPKSDQHQISS